MYAASQQGRVISTDGTIDVTMSAYNTSDLSVSKSLASSLPVQSPIPSGLITIKSTDRYTSPAIQSDPSSQTSSIDVTYNLPNLAQYKRIMPTRISETVSSVFALNRPNGYTNFISVSYNNAPPVIITVNFDSLISNSTGTLDYVTAILQNCVKKYFFDNTFVVNNLGSSNTVQQTFARGAGVAIPVQLAYVLAWKSTVATVSFQRVSVYNGMDVSSQLQLFDICGLGYTNISGVLYSQTSPINGYAQGTCPVLATPVFVDIVTPDFDNTKALDVSTTNSKNSFVTLARIYNQFPSLNSEGVSGNLTSNLVVPFQRWINLNENQTSMRIMLVDDKGNLLPLRTPTLAVDLYTFPSGILAMASGTNIATITFSTTPSPTPLTVLTPGTVVVIGATTDINVNNTATVISSTSTVLTVQYPTINTSTAFSNTVVQVSGPHILSSGLSVGYGGNPEYDMSFLGSVV